MHCTPSSNSFSPSQVKKRVRRTLLWAGLLSAAIAIGAFLGALKLFPRIQFLPGAPGAVETDTRVPWELLEGFAGLATLCLVIGGLVFAYIEYRRSAIHDSRESALSSFNIYKEMYDRLTCPEDTQARRWIMENLRTLDDMGGDQAKWLAYNKAQLERSPEGEHPERPLGREYLKRVLNTFDFVGYVDKHYWAMEYDLVRWMNPPIAKVWARISCVVEAEAEERKEPDFYRAARDLGCRCLEWRQDNYPGSTFIENGT
jgi:hypothetical protein